MNVQHSSRYDGWLTPLDVLNRVRYVLGSIDLDPATSATANKRVGAKQIITAKENALATEWDAEEANIFLNPPGGKCGNKSTTSLFWQKLMSYRDVMRHAVFLAFNAEALQHTQFKGGPSIGDFVFCIPGKRLRFDLPEGFVKKTSPSNSNAIVYVPGTVDHHQLFVEAFSPIGVVCRGLRPQQACFDMFGGSK